MFKLLGLLVFICFSVQSEELVSAKELIKEDKYKKIFEESIKTNKLDGYKKSDVEYYYHEVSAVKPDGWADKAGLKVGDQILKVRNFRVTRKDDLLFINKALGNQPFEIELKTAKGEKKIINSVPGEIIPFRWSVKFNPQKIMVDEVKDLKEPWIGHLYVALANYRTNLAAAETAIFHALKRGAPKKGFLVFLLAEINKYNLNHKKALNLFKTLLKEKSVLGSIACERYISLQACFGGMAEVMKLKGKTDIFVNFDQVQAYDHRLQKIIKSRILTPEKTHKTVNLLKEMKHNQFKHLAKRNHGKTIKSAGRFSMAVPAGAYNSFSFERPVQNGEIIFTIQARPSDQRKTRFSKTVSVNFVDENSDLWHPSILKNGMPHRRFSMAIYQGKWVVLGPEPIYRYEVYNQEIMKSQINVIHFRCFNGLGLAEVDDKKILVIPSLNIERQIFPVIKCSGATMHVQQIRYNEFISKEPLKKVVVTDEIINSTMDKVVKGNAKERKEVKGLIFSWGIDEWKKCLKKLDSSDPEQNILIEELKAKVSGKKSFIKQTLF